MKFVFLKIALTVCLFITAVTSNAQNFGHDCLGTHCYITVYINRDPVTHDGFLKYTIVTPPEGAVDIQGPAGSHLSNNWGSTVDIYIRKSHLDLAADGVNCEVPFELLVNKWFNGSGYNTDGNGVQCFYWIKLMVDYS